MQDNGFETLPRLVLGSARNSRAVAALLAFFVLTLVASAAEVPCGGLTFSETFDDVQTPNLPAGWTASQGANSGDPLWITSATTPYTAPNAAFTAVPDHVLDNRLDSPGFSAFGGPGTLYFRHKFDFQNGLDGAVLEVSAPNLNGGQFTEFTAATGHFSTGGYNGTVVSPSNPLAGRPAWTGNSGGYVRVVADVSTIMFNYGSPIKIRFRMASDESGSSGGWWIDHIAVQYSECNPPSPTPTPTCFPHWTSGPAAPMPALHSAGVYFPANGRFYVMGGRSSDAVGSDLMHPVEFDPVTNAWAIKAAMFPDNMVNDMVCGVLSDPTATPFIYCVGGSAAGGSTATARLFRYDPVADSITQVASPWPGNPGADTLPGGGVAASNKLLYVLGGYQIGIGMTDKIWEFRSDTNVWVQKASVLPVPLGYLAVMADSNFIYTVGGTVFEPPGTLYDIANVFVYNPNTNQIGRSYPLPRQTSGARTFKANLERKVLGGGNQNTSAQVDVFSNYWQVWVRGEDLAVPRRNFAAATDGTRIWLTGGYSSGNTPLSSMEIYQCPASSPTPTPTPTPSPSPTPTATPTSTPIIDPTPTPVPSQPLNISTRLRVDTGDRIAIGGFIINGTGPKKVAIRGIGPSLANFGLSDVLADPTLELRDNAGALVAQNDNWQDNSFQAAQLIELGLAPQHPNESGIVATLQPGAYTALLAGKNQTSGLALVEVYDADATSGSQLANISTRGFVRTGNDVMIGGFILGNSGGSAHVVVRGIGPSLGQFGLNNVLADPTLELRDSNGAILVANDNWQDDLVSAAQLTARGLAPSRSEESGIFASLPAGAFTAILAGKNGGIGLGLVEVYNVP